MKEIDWPIKIDIMIHQDCNMIKDEWLVDTDFYIPHYLVCDH